MKEVIKDVLNSLKNEPTRWSYDKDMIDYSTYKYKIYRDDGIRIWVANGAYGITIHTLTSAIGKIYFWWTLFGGAPWQHKIYNAYKKWDKEHG